jgi:predicted transposase YbfD/YdcC
MELNLERLPLHGEGGLFEVLEGFPDPRKPRGVRHKIQSILATAICAVLAGASSFVEIAEWAADQPRETLRKLGSLKGKPPSERTYRRVLGAIDVEELDRRTGRWVAKQVNLGPGMGLALDGKTLRGSREGDRQGLHLLSAIVHGEGTVVAQTPVDSKTNEITRVAPLLKEMDIRGVVVTADALLTQQKIARHLVEEKGADYVFVVKGNQGTLLDDVKQEFAEPVKEAMRLHRARKRIKGKPNRSFPPQESIDEKGHGRIETRQIWVSSKLNDYVNFPHVAQVFAVWRAVTDLHGNQLKGRKSIVEVAYGVTSLPPEKASPAQLLAFNRGHWEIENRLHYIRDVTFKEDRSKIRRHNRPHALASLRNLAISLLRLVGANNIASPCRCLARRAQRPLRVIGLVL